MKLLIICTTGITSLAAAHINELARQHGWNVEADWSTIEQARWKAALADVVLYAPQAAAAFQGLSQDEKAALCSDPASGFCDNEHAGNCAAGTAADGVMKPFFFCGQTVFFRHGSQMLSVTDVLSDTMIPSLSHGRQTSRTLPLSDRTGRKDTW